jgi:hypothetical protein
VNFVIAGIGLGMVQTHAIGVFAVPQKKAVVCPVLARRNVLTRIGALRFTKNRAF